MYNLSVNTALTKIGTPALLFWRLPSSPMKIFTKTLERVLWRRIFLMKAPTMKKVSWNSKSFQDLIRKFKWGNRKNQFIFGADSFHLAGTEIWFGTFISEDFPGEYSSGTLRHGFTVVEYCR